MHGKKNDRGLSGVTSASMLHRCFLFYAGALQTLLELGASPNYKDSRGLTALYHTALVGGDTDCCELLLNQNASVCCQDENGWHEIHQVSFITDRSIRTC